jgi:hypothetical protein
MVYPRWTIGSRFMRATSLLVLGLASLTVAACEEHPKRVVQGAPEYLHEALTGDIRAQARLADCLVAGGDCIDTPSDPPMACAWRGVRLASRSPTLSLADADAYRVACASSDQTFRQRAAFAQENFTRRLYRRPSPAAGVSPPQTGLLYPSAEAVRQRINAELKAASQPALPPFGPAQAVPNQARLTWKSCSPAVCLEGVSPDFGGGLFSYRVVVTGPQERARPLAARLATAALELDAFADLLASSPEQPRGVMAGSACWVIGRARADAVFAGASLGPC